MAGTDAPGVLAVAEAAALDARTIPKVKLPPMSASFTPEKKEIAFINPSQDYRSIVPFWQAVLRSVPTALGLSQPSNIIRTTDAGHRERSHQLMMLSLFTPTLAGTFGLASPSGPSDQTMTLPLISKESVPAVDWINPKAFPALTERNE